MDIKLKELNDTKRLLQGGKWKQEKGKISLFLTNYFGSVNFNTSEIQMKEQLLAVVN